MLQRLRRSPLRPLQGPALLHGTPCKNGDPRDVPYSDGDKERVSQGGEMLAESLRKCDKRQKSHRHEVLTSQGQSPQHRPRVRRPPPSQRLFSSQSQVTRSHGIRRASWVYLIVPGILRLAVHVTGRDTPWWQCCFRSTRLNLQDCLESVDEVTNLEMRFQAKRDALETFTLARAGVQGILADLALTPLTESRASGDRHVRVRLRCIRSWRLGREKSGHGARCMGRQGL